MAERTNASFKVTETVTPANVVPSPGQLIFDYGKNDIDDPTGRDDIYYDTTQGTRIAVTQGLERKSNLQQELSLEEVYSLAAYASARAVVNLVSGIRSDILTGLQAVVDAEESFINETSAEARRDMMEGIDTVLATQEEYIAQGA